MVVAVLALEVSAHICAKGSVVENVRERASFLPVHQLARYFLIGARALKKLDK